MKTTHYKFTVKALFVSAACLSFSPILRAQEGIDEPEDIFVAGSSSVYIVPLTDGGQLPEKSDLAYAGEIEMEPGATAGVFTAKDVRIDNGGNGFLFYGRNLNAGCLYYLAESATQTVLQMPYNKLAISGKDIVVPDGTYDIEFIGRNVAGLGYHVFTIKKYDSSETLYPESLYIVSATGEVQTLAQAADHPGYYQSQLKLPPKFFISNSPDQHDGYFVYGPINATDDVVALNKPVNIAINTHTAPEYYFSLSDAKATDDYFVAVDLGVSPAVLTVSRSVITSVDKIFSANDGETVVYTIDGRRSSGLERGIYIERTPDGTTRKIFISGN